MLTKYVELHSRQAKLENNGTGQNWILNVFAPYKSAPLINGQLDGPESSRLTLRPAIRLTDVLFDSLVDAVDLVLALLQKLLRASDALGQVLQVVHQARLANVVAHVLEILRNREGKCRLADCSRTLGKSMVWIAGARTGSIFRPLL